MEQRETLTGGDGQDLLRVGIAQKTGGLVEGAARVGHVVDQNGDLVADLADEHHPADNIGAGSLERVSKINPKEPEHQRILPPCG